MLNVKELVDEDELPQKFIFSTFRFSKSSRFEKGHFFNVRQAILKIKVPHLFGKMEKKEFYKLVSAVAATPTVCGV